MLYLSNMRFKGNCMNQHNQHWVGLVFVHGNLYPCFILALSASSSPQVILKVRLLCLPNPTFAELHPLGHPSSHWPWTSTFEQFSGCQ